MKLIINESFGSRGSFNLAELESLDYAYSRGALIVKSAGNGGADRIGDANIGFHQSGFQLTVAATDMTDAKTRFSDYGIDVDLSAPGQDILTSAIQVNAGTVPNNPATLVSSYRAVNGTSFSAPITSGVAALIWSQHPTWSRDQVAARLRGTADPIDEVTGNTRFSQELGAGRVNAAEAVNAAFTIPAPEVTKVELTSSLGNDRFDGVRVYFSETVEPFAANRPRITSSSGQDPIPLLGLRMTLRLPFPSVEAIPTPGIESPTPPAVTMWI